MDTSHHTYDDEFERMQRDWARQDRLFVLRLGVITFAFMACWAILLFVAPQAFSMPRPKSLTVHSAECPEIGGGSCSSTTTNDIWLGDGADEFDREHEIGHQFDQQILADQNRKWFMQALRLRGDWSQGTGDQCDSHRCPDELFADAYAACALGLNPAGRMKFRGRSRLIVGAWTTAYGYSPGVRQHRRICNTIAFIGAAAGR